MELRFKSKRYCLDFNGSRNGRAVAVFGEGMSARPLLRMSDAANGLLAAAGLVAVAALSASSLGAGGRLAIEGCLPGYRQSISCN
ncbi:hypothetical protein ACQKGL_24405 [Ensifer adhaerens]|uniref:hypothetical protein n=1 Tax=Ensifer adhaerens TaxID=106592 RepID=UPI003CFF1F69